MARAKAMKPEIVAAYYEELESVLVKYNILNKPENIYNLDETGCNTQHTPPKVLARKGPKVQGITSHRSVITTVISCGNALIGSALPPYFVFQGKRLSPDLLHGQVPGTQAIMSDSGWSNSIIFMEYLQTLFVTYARPGSEDASILLVYDGQKSHINLQLIQWAKENNIVLFVLPPHLSHLSSIATIRC